MNEIEELLKLDVKDLPPLKPMLLDDLYQNALKNLHLELGTGPVLYLLSPSYSVMTPTPNDAVTDLITRKEALLDHLKEYIIQNLAMYSVLIDTSSYFIEQNGFLVLARLRERDSEGRRYEIKFYTHSPQGAPEPLRGQDLHRQGLHRPLQLQPEILGGQGIHHLSQGPVRSAPRAGPRPDEKPAGLQVLLPGDPGIGQRAPHGEPAASSSPCRRSSISASSPARTSSRSTPSTGRSTISSSSSTTRWPSSRTCSGSRRRPISSAT